MHILLFARDSKEDQTLPQFSSRVFAALGLDISEERESSNFPPEDRYFLAYASNASVEVCHSDDDLSEIYPFWVVVKDSRTRMPSSQSIPTDPSEVATILASSGFQIFLPSAGWGKVDWDQSGSTFGA